MQKIIGCSVPVVYEGHNIIITSDSTDALKSFLGEKYPNDLVPLETGIILGREWESSDHLTDCLGLALKLDGIDYADSIENRLADAKEKGLLVITGASDDLTEFYGVWRDEAGLGKIIFDANGILPSVDEIRDSDEADDIVAWGVRRKAAKVIRASHGETGHKYDMGEIPHAEFRVFDGDDLFSTGVVIHISNL